MNSLISLLGQIYWYHLVIFILVCIVAYLVFRLRDDGIYYRNEISALIQHNSRLHEKITKVQDDERKLLLDIVTKYESTHGSFTETMTEMRKVFSALLERGF